MKKIILLGIAVIIAVLMVSGCKTGTIVMHDTRDSIVYRHRIDSVRYTQIDSVLIRQRGDTVFVDRMKYRYLTSTKIDTARVYVDKVVNIPYEVEIVKRVVPKWCWWLLGGNVLILVLCGIWIFLSGKIIRCLDFILKI